MGKAEQRRIVWAPQPGPQAALVTCPAEEVFFGGSRGGGKTDGVLGKWAIKAFRYGSAFNAVMFRRTVVAADDAIERSRQIYGPLGGRWQQQGSKWTLPGGGRISFRYLDKITDADHFQGRNLTDAWVEEAGQYATPDPIDRLQGALRSPKGVPIQLILTANPGGPGQQWLRERYRLHPLPQRPCVVDRKVTAGGTIKAAVIPSRLTDNRILMAQDPRYRDRLRLVGSEKLVQAWLDGDWSAIEGTFFSEWDESRHVVQPFHIPEAWPKIRSFDWGSARPFSVGWWAVAHSDPNLQDGTLVRYREWYGAKGANVGLKLPAEVVAAGILEREAGERIDTSVADPAIFAEDGGPSLAERMGLPWQPADNKRVGSMGHLGGWDQMRARLRDRSLVVFSTCTDFIRTVPLLQHDRTRAEDLDSDMEDHIADEARYACMTRPWFSGNINRHRFDDGPEPPNTIRRINRKRAA